MAVIPGTFPQRVFFVIIIAICALVGYVILSAFSETTFSSSYSSLRQPDGIGAAPRLWPSETMHFQHEDDDNNVTRGGATTERSSMSLSPQKRLIIYVHNAILSTTSSRSFHPLFERRLPGAFNDDTILRAALSNLLMPQQVGTVPLNLSRIYLRSMYIDEQLDSKTAKSKSN